MPSHYSNENCTCGTFPEYRCTLHRSAPALLEALEALMSTIDRPFAKVPSQEQRSLARAAIAAATADDFDESGNFIAPKEA